MSNTDRTGTGDSKRDPSRDGTLDPDAPALDDNAKAGFGEKGPDLPDDQDRLDENEKLEDAVSDLDASKN